MVKSKLLGKELDLAVAEALGYKPTHPCGGGDFLFTPDGDISNIVLKSALNFSTDWSQAGPIIEESKMTIEPRGTAWYAYTTDNYHCYSSEGRGDTPLIAAMLCYLDLVYDVTY